MRLGPNDLARHLQAGLAPVYLLSGDEPLQIDEAQDAVRDAAAARGFTTRERFEAGTGFDWNQLLAEANSLSLFAEKKLIELRIPGGKPGAEGGAALSAYCAAPPPDTLLLLTLPKLERVQLSAKWLKAVESVGVLVQVWPIEGRALLQWLERRMRAIGLEPGPEVVEMLGARVEGNLLAARQEIEKLLLLCGPGAIDAKSTATAVADSARYDVFDLIDGALRGEAPRCVRILAGLRSEGVAAPVVLWALARELRVLIPLASAVAQGRSVAQAMTLARVWEKRKPLLGAALKRLEADELHALLTQCQGIDSAIKGGRTDDPWLGLEQLALALAGTAAIPLAG